MSHKVCMNFINVKHEKEGFSIYIYISHIIFLELSKENIRNKKDIIFKI
jgi:hypothetical protein